MHDVVKKNHRTAIFVRRSKNSSEEYLERTAALVGSLNRPPSYGSGGTVKVDVYTVCGNKITAGLTDSLSPPAPEVKGPSAMLLDLLATEGFTIHDDDDDEDDDDYDDCNEDDRINSPDLRNLAMTAGYTVVSIVTGQNDD